MGGEVPHVELSLIEDPNRLPPDRVADATQTGQRPPRTRSSSQDPRRPPEPERPERPDRGPAHLSSLERWASVVTSAAEPSLVLAADSTIVAASTACAEMIGLRDPDEARGCKLREAGVQLVDFTPSLEELDSAEADKIPPLMAISSGRLARGLMRVVCPESKLASTLDAIATPLWDGSTVVGSLTFFSRI